jgi:hypothetical protein
MKKFKGHLLPDDLYYLVLSYNDKTNWQWFKDNNLTIPKDLGFSLVNKLSSQQLTDLILNAVDFNLNLIKYETENS